jgi:hypothetical protein
MHEVQMKIGKNLYVLLIDVDKENGENVYYWVKEIAP